MSEMTKQGYSYDFDMFSEQGREKELKRLYTQATIAKEQEINFIDSLQLPENASVLEIGCGPGFVTGILGDLVPKGTAHGLDASKELLEAADKLVKPHHSNLSFFEGSAYELPFQNNTYDFIYNRLIYQHLNNPLKALQEANRVCKKGGMVTVLDVDAGMQLIEPACPAFEKLNQLACEAQMKYGGDRYIGRKLPSLMQQAGFSKVDFKVLPLSSLDFKLADYINITTRFKAMIVGTSEANQLINEIDTFCNAQKTEPFVFVSVFAVTGIV